MYLFLLILPLCLFSLHAQTMTSISGEVVVSGGSVDPSRLTVEVVGMQSNMNQSPERVLVGPNGRFEARNLTAGSYQFRVYDDRGNLMGSAVQTAGQQYGNVEIRVNGAAAGSLGSNIGRAISVKNLRADPNGKAERELEQALWYVRDKNFKNAVKHFEKALRADEGYSRAAANWAALELQMGNAAKAEEIARKALQRDANNPRLQHALGASLVAQQIYSDETVNALAGAGKESPKTLLAAAQVEYKRGNWSKARRYAKAYLDTGDKEFKAFAEKVKELPDTSK